jgi:hypothetical protein
MLGRVPWNKGKKGLQKHSDKTKKKMSLARSDEKHWLWKDDKVGYSALHIWVVKKWGAAKKVRL